MTHATSIIEVPEVWQREFFPLVELALFMVCGAALLSWMSTPKLQRFLPSQEGAGRISLLEFVALGAIAVHMANYLYSGLTKVALGDHFFDWVLENNATVVEMAELIFSKVSRRPVR